MDALLVDFLLRAKRATYAGHGAEAESSRPASHDLGYAEGRFAYYDTYLGGERFAGEEALWDNGAPVWAMNYCGRVLDPAGFSGDFLKAALFAVPPETPFRGPKVFQDGAFTYRCQVEGDADWFAGREWIEKDGALIYEGAFHGGIVR